MPTARECNQLMSHSIISSYMALYGLTRPYKALPLLWNVAYVISQVKQLDSTLFPTEHPRAL